MSGGPWLLAIGWFAAACAAGTAPPDVPSPLHIEVDLGPPATIHALYRGDAPEGLTYQMVVLREGAAGRSESSQSGRVAESDTLAVSRVNIAAGDQLSVQLTLSDSDGVIDSTSWARTIAP